MSEGVLAALVLDVVLVTLGVLVLEVVEHLVHVRVVAVDELAHRVYADHVLAVAGSREATALCSRSNHVKLLSYYPGRWLRQRTQVGREIKLVVADIRQEVEVVEIVLVVM